MPRVSVLLPVLNAKQYLRDAIESILNQTFRDFELLVIDDGSTDGSPDIVDSIHDQRIQLYRQPNEGLISKLNFGLGTARGKYIARMDADDISLPERLQKQVHFLEQHPSVGVVGTWSQSFTQDEKTWITKQPTSPDVAWAMLLLHVPLSHPTVMFRMDCVRLGGWRYSKNALHTEDYDLWSNIGENTQLSNVPEVLFRYRVHANQISNVQTLAQLQASANIRKMLIEKIGVQPTSDDLAFHEKLVMQQWDTGSDFLNRIDSWFKTIASANNTTKRYTLSALQEVFRPLWVQAAIYNHRLGKTIRTVQLHNPLIGPAYHPQIIARHLLSLIHNNE